MQLSRVGSKILPSKVDNSFSGLRIAVVFFSIIAVISAVRSLVHIFSPDGGAEIGRASVRERV